MPNLYIIVNLEDKYNTIGRMLENGYIFKTIPSFIL